MEKEMIESIVREVVKNYDGSGAEVEAEIKKRLNKSSSSAKVDANKDYPLGTERPDLVKTPTNKTLDDISLEKVLSGEVTDADVRISAETLELQADFARQRGREQFAKNLERAAELTKIPDERVLEIYNALRPYRSTKKELLDIADELKDKYDAQVSASLVKQSAEVYEARGRLKEE